MELRKLAPDDFEQVHDLMGCSFPLVERRHHDAQKALLDHPHYAINALYDDENRVRAFMALWEFEPFVFFEHFAVHPDCRNGGIGAGMLRELLSRIPKRVCLEVEPPETELAQRRIRFYERNGLFLNRYPYIQPPLNEESSPIPLMVMSTGSPLSPEEFATVKETLYREVYGLPEGHALFATTSSAELV